MIRRTRSWTWVDYVVECGPAVFLALAVLSFVAVVMTGCTPNRL